MKDIGHIPSARIRVFYSVWLAILASLKIISNDYIYSKNGRLYDAIFNCRAFFVLLITFCLCYAALSIHSAILNKFKDKIKEQIVDEIKNLSKDLRFEVFTILLLFAWFLAKGVPIGAPISYVISEIKVELQNKISFLLHTLTTLSFLIVLAVISACFKNLLKLLLRKYPLKDEINASLEEWYIGSVLFIVLGAVLLWVGHFTLSEINNPASLSYATTGLYKDTFIFIFLASCLVNAMLRYRELMPLMGKQGLMNSLTIFLSFAVFLVILFLTLDFVYITMGLEISPEFPKQWQKDSIRIITVFRDFILWLALSISIFSLLVKRYFCVLSNLSLEKEDKQCQH